MSATLEGKIAIVTGGSGGIGSVICERLSEEGATVVVHYSGHEEAAKQVVQYIEAHKRDRADKHHSRSGQRQVVCNPQVEGNLSLTVGISGRMRRGRIRCFSSSRPWMVITCDRFADSTYIPWQSASRNASTKALKTNLLP